jgi:uncharacterized protein (DUF952 family)
MRTTFHLVPAEVWTAAEARLAGGARYAAASLETDGFIHCTDGVDALGVTFDRFYAVDPRPFLALTLDLDALDVPWRYDDPGKPYPHIYGEIRAEAVMAEAAVERQQDGRFAGLRPIGPDEATARTD